MIFGAFRGCGELSLSKITSVVEMLENVYVIACALSYVGACVGLLQDESCAPDV